MPKTKPATVGRTFLSALAFVFLSSRKRDRQAHRLAGALLNPLRRSRPPAAQLLFFQWYIAGANAENPDRFAVNFALTSMICFL